MNQGAGRGGSNSGSARDGLPSRLPTVSHHLTRVAIVLGTAAILVGAAIGYGSYAVSRSHTLRDISEDSLHLAGMLAETLEVHQPSSHEQARAELERLWRNTERGFRKRYLWMVDANGILAFAAGGPEKAGSHVGDIRIRPAANGGPNGGPTTLRQLVAAKRNWVGQTRTPSGVEQIAAYVYSRELDALVGVNVPAAEVGAELRESSLPWLAGFACTICTLLLSLTLLHRAYSSSRQVTDRTLTALQESEERFRQLISQAADAIVLFDQSGRILDANQQACEAFGSSREELMQLSIGDVEAQPDALHDAEAWAQLDQTGTATFERLFRRKNGDIFPAEVRAARVVIQGERQYVAAARDITDRKRSEEEKAVLLDVARAVAGTLDLDEILDRVQRRTAQAFSCDTVATFRLDSARKVIRLISHYGLPPELEPAASSLEYPIDTVFDQRSVQSEPVVFNDFIQADSWLAGLAARFGVTAMLSAPLQSRGRRLGYFVAIRRAAGHPFEPRELDLCNGIAQELAVAIDVVDVYRAQQEEAQVSGALAAVGHELISTLSAPVVLDRLCELTTRQLECDFSCVALLQAKEDMYSPVSVYGLSAEEWEEIRLTKVPQVYLSETLAKFERDGLLDSEALRATPWPEFDRRLGMESILCVTIRRGQEIIGLLVVGHRVRDRRFTVQQERILRGIAQLASMALENARLVDELQQANRLKSEFVATMSHELRTPLNVILGYSDLVLEGAFGDLNKEQADTIGRIERSGQQLLELINATLDISRFEGRNTPLDLKDVVVSDLAHEIDADVREWLSNPHLSFAWSVAPHLPPLRTDPMKLKVLLKNLIGNAVKFTERGSVSVAVTPLDGRIEFAVSDTGIGIAPEVLTVIFEPFRQGDSSSTRRYGGVGLGLYIVRRIVNSLGGTIEVDSTVGRGSCFRVRLPLQPAGATAAASPLGMV